MAWTYFPVVQGDLFREVQLEEIANVIVAKGGVRPIGSWAEGTLTSWFNEVHRFAAAIDLIVPDFINPDTGLPYTKAQCLTKAFGKATWTYEDDGGAFPGAPLWGRAPIKSVYYNEMTQVLDLLV